MKRTVLLVSFTAFLGAALAQTSPSPTVSAAAAKPAQTATGQAGSATAKPVTVTVAKPTTAAATTPPWIKLPPGVPHVVHGPVKSGITLHYEDVKVGAGALGESGKLWHIKYTGWRASDGVKFDSWDEHMRPKMGPDGKPVMGPDNKPEMGDPEPLEFPQGMGRVIPGFDYGLDGMHIGGKRRIFIPWQLAYGTRNIPDRPDHPGIPAKSDLIFDVELVAVTEMPVPPQRPMMPQRPIPPAHPGAPGAAPGSAPGSPAAPGAPATTVKPAVPSTPPNATPPNGSAPPANPAQPSTPQSSTPQPSTPQASTPASSTRQPSTPQQ
jgi:peptidylprolyl isomerase